MTGRVWDALCLEADQYQSHQYCSSLSSEGGGNAKAGNKEETHTAEVSVAALRGGAFPSGFVVPLEINEA